MHHISMVLQGNFSLFVLSKARHTFELALRDKRFPLRRKQLCGDDIHSVQEEIQFAFIDSNLGLIPLACWLYGLLTAHDQIV